MVALRSRRFLRCFYCGKKSNIEFNAQKSFDCLNCDATNWLDSNGEITDPPAAANGLERSHLQYARSPSPLAQAADGPADDPVFCATCLRNQHMLSSSLAQFEWPDDATSAEHSARERKYWALKKALEQRYPQVCEECLPKVNKKLNQASYTAKTDHLRRMMDRTRSQWAGGKRRGPLDVIDFLGKMSWYTGFAFQAVWHVAIVLLLSTEPYASTQDGHWILVTLGRFHRMSALMLPYSDWFMRWAINLGMCSFPWNPRFRQSIRGFTAHILGFRQWYTYQLLVLFVRFVALSIAQYSKAQQLPATTQLTAQFLIFLFMIYVYRTAKKSIHTNTAPLFRQPPELTASPRVKSGGRPATKDPDDLGNILDDILHSPTPQQVQAVRTSPRHSTSLTSSLGSRTLGQRVDRGSAISVSTASNGAMQVSPENPAVTHYGDEMDWSPSASQHRAFSSYNPYKVKNTNPRFSDAPTEPKSGPIWYKVPPAPINPAQRLRNPPMRPIIRESPKGEKESFFRSDGRQPLDFGSSYHENLAELPIAPPKFHAPEPIDDPRDGLSSMFAHSFSISPDPEERIGRSVRTRGTADLQRDSDIIPNRTMTRTAELIALFAALCSWIFALSSEEHYGRSLALASIIVCLMVSIRLAADLEVDNQIRGATRSSTVNLSLAKLALVQVGAVILFMWKIWSESASSASSGTLGNTMFGGIIAHQIWHIFA
ncbi:Ima1 N-terminal domain-containing protein [Xylaria flabelliformis]|nr:Ima1 N-terminal domain-containing protein [Xylaria flabelliformis]